MLGRIILCLLSTVQCNVCGKLELKFCKSELELVRSKPVLLERSVENPALLGNRIEPHLTQFHSCSLNQAEPWRHLLLIICPHIRCDKMNHL